jgi:bla regulator protein blaR1
MLTFIARLTAQNFDKPRTLCLLSASVAIVVAAIAIGLLNAAASPAQSPSGTDQTISYVASVKLNNEVDPRGGSEYSPGGRFTATAITVGQLLRTAYRIQGYQLVGAPSWVGSRRYDIVAKVEDNPAPSQQVFLRALLKDRFKLVAHNETRDMPIFALVVARRDGKLGPQLTKSDFDCAAYRASTHAPPEPGRTPNCSTRINLGALNGKAILMSTLATSLAPFVSRFTVDKTGLTGGFDVELTWTSDPAFPSTGNSLADAAPNSSGPSIFAALQEQLGLKLVADKGPVAILVVDHLEEPSAN